ncbi:MAG TPA: nicotinate-nucleotide adenylyltransferase [Xanthobacteraceae bacterium]|nr:nicotinate-nucleotide adenylyltransferase [Xanthobacteraceae bacterium]
MRLPQKHWVKPPGPAAPGLRIGLLGGSFNPAHAGHVHISEVALKRLKLDYVWWLVAPHNPLKPTIGMAPLDDRVALAREAALHPRILVMDIERALGTRYTIDTLGALQTRFPNLRFVWLMGSDNLDQFRRWRRWTEIATRIPIAVVMRPGTTLAPLRAKAAQRLARSRRCAAERVPFARPPAFIVLDGPRNTASSTAIRAQSQESEALVGAIPSW